MEKRGQLGVIEFKYFMSGFFFGILGGLVLVFLGTKKILPFQVPLVCGLILPSSKKGQLGVIEFKYFLSGFGIGLLTGLILIYLGTAKVLPFQIPLVCG